jgi:hypothetical protein
MTPQERQMVDDLFDRLSKVEGAPRDPDAGAAISQGLSRAPNAVYALVQTVLVQDEALKRADARIQELERGGASEQSRGGFLDSMRDSIFGQSQPRGSVPNVPPPANGRPAWNTGQVLQQAPGAGRYDQGQPNQAPYNQGPYNQPYGAPQAPGGGGGSFLGTAAAAAAGAVGGGLLMNSIRSMMGGGHQSGFGDSAGLGGGRSPWASSSDESGSGLARDAGVNDVGSSGRDRPFDQAQADADQDQDQDQDDDDDRDAMDLDSDNGGDNDSDYV